MIDKVGLDSKKAKQILSSNAYEQDVRDLQSKYQSAGISSVPAVIINNKHLISGGQPADVFEKAIREIAAEDWFDKYSISIFFLISSIFPDK